MPKKSSNSGSRSNSEHQTLILVVIVAIVAFGFGFIVARAKYKAQLKTTYNMVIERDEKISKLNTKFNNMQTILKMTPGYNQDRP